MVDKIKWIFEPCKIRMNIYEIKDVFLMKIAIHIFLIAMYICYFIYYKNGVIDFTNFTIDSMTCIYGPIIEEIFFKMILYRFVRRSAPYLGANIGVSLFFSLLHPVTSFSSWFGVFLFSYVSIKIFEKYKNIYYTIALHIVDNILIYNKFIPINVVFDNHLLEDKWVILVLIFCICIFNGFILYAFKDKLSSLFFKQDKMRIICAISVYFLMLWYVSENLWVSGFIIVLSYLYYQTFERLKIDTEQKKPTHPYVEIDCEEMAG